MKGSHGNRVASTLALGALGATLIAPQLHAGPRAKQQASMDSTPVAFALSAKPPKGAIVLISGKPADIAANWYKRYTTTPADWTMDGKGVTSPKKDDITSKQEFGDCYVHAEFLEPVDASGKTIGEGNSGVGLQGRYEVQILDSYGKKPEDTGCGAFYSQIPPIVVASRKPTEWQTYDIIFRAPRFDANGQLTEKPRATVFQNGILVQNNQEFLGMTGIQYGEYKEMVKTGPIVLQGDHDPVHFRNVWVVSL